MCISSTDILKNEYLARKLKNPMYSLRAFARDLGISRTAISDVVRGSRSLSIQNIDLLAQALKLDPEMIGSLKNEFYNKQETERQTIENPDLDFIEDWHYLGILSLAKLAHNEYSAKWVSMKLGLKLEVAESALQFLSTRGYIQNVSGRIVRILADITTTLDIPSASIVECHRQSLQKAAEALEEVAVERRDFSAITYAIDPHQLAEVKEYILQFHRRLGKKVATNSASEVYRLNIQFFPLTR